MSSQLPWISLLEYVHRALNVPSTDVYRHTLMQVSASLDKLFEGNMLQLVSESKGIIHCCTCVWVYSVFFPYAVVHRTEETPHPD